MQISKYNVPRLCVGELEIAEMTRHQRFVVCIVCDEGLQKLIIEFENEFLAERFADAIEAGTAETLIEVDFSLDGLGEEAKLEYELAKLSGDEERLEKLLKTLWEDDGIDPERTTHHEMSGIKRILIVQYGSVHGIGFRSEPDRYAAWLEKFDLLNRIVCGFVFAKSAFTFGVFAPFCGLKGSDNVAKGKSQGCKR